MKRTITLGLLGILVVLITALAVPASAAPTDSESFPVTADCDGTAVQGVYEEWVQTFTLDNQVVQLGHATVTYTFEGKTFRFVEAYVDREYTNRDGEYVSTRRGRLLGGLTGYWLEKGVPPEVVQHGLVSPTAEEQACAALVG